MVQQELVGLVHDLSPTPHIGEYVTQEQSRGDVGSQAILPGDESRGRRRGLPLRLAPTSLEGVPRPLRVVHEIEDELLGADDMLYQGLEWGLSERRDQQHRQAIVADRCDLL